MRAASALILAGLALAVACLAYLSLGARGDWGFVLMFRGARLVALLTVALAVALSTMVFQTLAANRILTPAIMGFDALFLLGQSLLVFTLSGVGVAALGAYVTFGLETAVMLLAALLLFGTLLRRGQDISRMILTGIVFGILFRSLTQLLNRMIDPNEFTMIQSAAFARFNNVPEGLTWITAGLTVAVGIWLMSKHRQLDVMALGRAASMTLGVDHDRQTRRLLAAVALLVSVSTALVGPIVFFGLLVSALAHGLAGSWRHAVLLPLSALLAGCILVASQTLFERVLHLQTSVAVVIEALGGLVFLAMILRRRKT
ncbi:iron chelate uptake ABC transporter family permease subunit [Pseudodonghicola flavimaris]|uniref:Iron chelate uptake ABC transporter family permease subunit n=1 Tax=Pseudodonghicola flavimaris TaxID=3050036 RepID=A0ABT7F5D0_9RHOB|nr:iron chelate uptake ABC transporter family permease subunit [Pseudodonghicola flavimaris]MDK3019813.1 iron chelate uptake ABC transporter family permease subunit [Pseudodonghicola flavimaris]